MIRARTIQASAQTRLEPKFWPEVQGNLNARSKSKTDLYRLRTGNLSGKKASVATQVESLHGDSSLGQPAILVGRPKHDLASEIARAYFEENAEAFKAFSKALLRGNGYVFKELANRAYARLKETHHLDMSPYKDVPAQDLEQQMKRLEMQLGYRKAEEVVPVLPPASESKPN